MCIRGLEHKTDKAGNWKNTASLMDQNMRYRHKWMELMDGEKWQILHQQIGPQINSAM